jgi:hypothetical protein
MGTAQVLDRAGDSDLDFQAVSQLTAMGALADEVVGDLIQISAGLIKGSDSAAIANAARIFAYAANAQSEPSSGLWDANRLPDALRLLADSSNVPTAILPSEDARAWVSSLATDLDQVARGEADSSVAGRLESTFRSISVATLGATAEALHQRGYASTWLTS